MLGAHPVANGDAVAIQENGIEVHVHVAPKMDVVSIVAVERRLDEGAMAAVYSTQQIRQQFQPLVLLLL